MLYIFSLCIYTYILSSQTLTKPVRSTLMWLWHRCVNKQRERERERGREREDKVIRIGLVDEVLSHISREYDNITCWMQNSISSLGQMSFEHRGMICLINEAHYLRTTFLLHNGNNWNVIFFFKCDFFSFSNRGEINLKMDFRSKTKNYIFISTS